MPNTLSPRQLAKARSLYNLFNIFNALSYTILAGSLITILAMRMNASSTIIGIISAFVYVSYFFLPLGKVLAKRFTITKVYSMAWILRSIAMSPLLAAPFAFEAGHHNLALGLIILGTFCFNLNRGIGMIGNNPVLNDLAVGPDRGAYMTLVQIINAALGMLTNLAVALLLSLWQDPPLMLYSIIIVFGIAGGVVSGILLTKVPEPEVDTSAEKINFREMLHEAFSEGAFKQFIVILFMIALVSGIARAFAVVYSREVFNQSDGLIVLYTVFGGFGQLMIGFLTKFLVDRIGAKPLFIICTVLGLLSMFPIVFFPASAVNNLAVSIVFLIFLLFMLNFGFLGAEGIAQTYFLGLIPSKYMLDMGIVYFICFGISGAGGSFFAGIFLDSFTSMGFSRFVSFKFLYILLIVITAVALFLQRKLVRLGSLPFKDALEVLFSFRDLRAITLLDKLNKTNDSTEEEAILDALHDTPSVLSIKGLLDRAKSPRLATRLEALRAMETLSTLNEAAEEALMADLVNNPYTTAYISARILGRHDFSSAIPLLRELAVSDDYMLAGEAIIALARLKDEVFRPHIEDIIVQTRNPRLKIMGVEAFGIYKSPYSLSVLLDILRQADPPPYLRDEVVLALSSILDLQHFYPLLLRYLDDATLAPMLAIDEAESAVEFHRSATASWQGLGTLFRKKPEDGAFRERQAKSLVPAIRSYMQDADATFLSRWILELPTTDPEIAQTLFAEAVFDDELNIYDRLRLFIVHWAAQELRQLSS
jgi:MFS family permease